MFSPCQFLCPQQLVLNRPDTGTTRRTSLLGSQAIRKKPSRAIKVIMQEHDGKMLFAPNHVEIQKGEQIKFELYNSGELDHEFVLATAQENQKHAEAMKMNPEMEHHDANATRVPPKKTDEIVWNFTKSGVISSLLV